MWRLIKDSGLKSKLVHTVPWQTFEGAIGRKITCDFKGERGVKLRIRHGTALVLTKVMWKVSDDESDNVIIGRPLLESVGISNKDLLASVCGKHDGIIDSKEISQEVEGNLDQGVRTLLEEAVLHSAGGINCSGLEEENIYIDIGDDAEEDPVAELEKRVSQAKEKGISEK